MKIIKIVKEKSWQSTTSDIEVLNLFSGFGFWKWQMIIKRVIFCVMLVEVIQSVSISTNTNAINPADLARILNIPMNQLNLLLQQQMNTNPTVNTTPNNMQQRQVLTTQSKDPSLLLLLNSTTPTTPIQAPIIYTVPQTLQVSDVVLPNNSSIQTSPQSQLQLQATSTTPAMIVKQSPNLIISNQTANNTTNLVNATTTASTLQNNCNGSYQYWTGFRCACKVGYCQKNGSCQLILFNPNIKFPSSFSYNEDMSQTSNQVSSNSNTNRNNKTVTSTPTITITTTNNNSIKIDTLNAVVNSAKNSSPITATVTTPTVQNISNHVTIQSVTPPTQSNSPTTTVVPNGPKQLKNFQIKCQQNQFDNGLGVCICQNGTFRFQLNGSCYKADLSTIPSCFGHFYFSFFLDSNMKATNITCQCQQGYTNYNNNNSNICSKCPNDSLYSVATNSCQKYCGINKRFNTTSSQCQCLKGYGQTFSDQCQLCQQIQMINMNGYCVKCPVGSITNYANQTCDCSGESKRNQQGICVKTCPNNQVLQYVNGYNQSVCSCASGLGIYFFTGNCDLCPSNTYPHPLSKICISCANNQTLINGKCQCNLGYGRNQNSQCMSCSSLNFTSNKSTFLLSDGRCAYCPGNQTYINASCKCGINYTKSGINCIPITCPLYEQLSISGVCQCAQFYVRNITTNVCQLSCKPDEQKAGNFCVKCNLNEVYALNVGCICTQSYKKSSNSSICQLSDSNTRTNSSLNVVNRNTNSPSVISDLNKTVSLNLSQITVKDQSNLTLLLMNFNINNIYLQFQIPFNISFLTQDQMQNFMHFDFPIEGTLPASVFCSQTNDKQTQFQCLLIYPSGIPNKLFTCNFYYNYTGYKGNQTLSINPLNSLKLQNSLSPSQRLR